MSVVPGRLVVIREGHGEQDSVENLVVRLAKDLNLYPDPFCSLSKSPRFVISSPETAVSAARIAGKLNPSAVLLTADREDSCPAQDAPAFAHTVKVEKFPFPVAVVFFYREYETLAISVADKLAGKTLRSPAGKDICRLTVPRRVPGNPEAPRDAKTWIGRELMGGVSYKPTVHQLPLTRAM